MTISEHLERIKKVMDSQEANEMEVLYFLLYLLCLGYDGLLLDLGGHRMDVEPYGALEKHFGYLWNEAAESDEHNGKGALQEFLEDENIIRNADKALFLVEFNELLAREARHGGYRFDHTQPEELSDLVCRLSGLQKGMSVYNPFAGFGSYASAFQVGNDYYGEEIDLLSWGVGVLKMHMDGSVSENFILGDSFDKNWDRRFDIVVSTPPSGYFLDETDGRKRRRLYSDILVDKLPDLLDSNGTCLIVNSTDTIVGPSAKTLVESSMLDMVMILPDNVMFSKKSVQVIVRLKKDRNPDAHILLVDAKDFYTPGGRRCKVLDVDRIMLAIRQNDDRHVVAVSSEEIKKKDFILFPDAYLSGDNCIEGAPYVALKELGTLFRPECMMPDEDPLSPYVSVKDLSPSPTHVVLPDRTEPRGNVLANVLTRPALLMARFSDSLWFGYLKDCSPERPICVSQTIMAFIPNEDIVTWEYVAAALSEVTLSNMGSSAFRQNFTDFPITKIPILSKREQSLYVKRILKKISPRRENAIESTRKIPVVTVGLSGIKDKTGRLSVLRRFERMNEAKNWLINHPSAAEAVITRIGEKVTESNVSSLCERMDNIPIFILTPNLEKLEAAFADNCIDYNLGERAFSLNMEDGLVETLAEVADLAITPEGKIRRHYSKQLDDAESLDNVFKYENVILRDELEELLVKLSMNDTKDLQNRMRKMRDNCLLKPLIDYGYLPNDLRWEGAVIDLLADRHYKLRDERNPSRIILNKAILPESVARLLQTMSKVVLNPGSHDYWAEDKNTLMACLCILMASLGVLADMVDRGNFKEKNSPKGYFSEVSPSRFRSGMYEVRRLEEIRGYDYFHAGNVHLDSKTCREIGIKVGDIVQVNSINDFEKDPKINDFVQVFFYSKEFNKVEQEHS